MEIIRVRFLRPVWLPVGLKHQTIFDQGEIRDGIRKAGDMIYILGTPYSITAEWLEILPNHVDPQL